MKPDRFSCQNSFFDFPVFSFAYFLSVIRYIHEGASKVDAAVHMLEQNEDYAMPLKCQPLI